MLMSEVFAAIHVGSYELTMKIFEISKKNGVRSLDHIRHRIDLGTETYDDGNYIQGSCERTCKSF